MIRLEDNRQGVLLHAPIMEMTDERRENGRVEKKIQDKIERAL